MTYIRPANNFTFREVNGAAPMGRLQRDYFGEISPVSSFARVLYRHGLTMGTAALMLILLSKNPQVLLTVLEDFSANPSMYILGFFATLAFFYFVLVRKRLSLNPIQGLWIVYLLYISIAEEIAFRLLLPIALESSVGFIYAIVLSNLVFALLHYITLRWKWQNCLFVFFGGIGLSRLLENSGDLTLVILVHFVATFLNTPSQPVVSLKPT